MHLMSLVQRNRTGRRAGATLRLLGVAALLAVALGIAACSDLPPIGGQDSTPAGPASSPGTEVPVGTSAPSAPAPNDKDVPVEAARLALAKMLDLDTAAIRVVGSTQAEWPDGCLGVEQPDVMCTQAIVRGYQVMLEVNGTVHEVRTDTTGGKIAIVAGQAPAITYPAAAKKARTAAASALGVPLESVTIVSAEQVEWPDVCLGVPDPLELCAQVLTPGYRVLLSASGEQLSYRTDETGAVARRERQPDNTSDAPVTPAPATDAIIVMRRDTSGCTDMQLDLDGVEFGACGEELAAGKFITGAFRADQLAELQRLYASFSASTSAGKIAFQGEGPLEASPVEQRMIAEWASLVVEEIKAGPGAAQFGLGWRREGGVAGFCDDLAIDAGGHAVLYSCADTSAAPRWRRLTDGELALFYGWVDQFAPGMLEQTDPATADAMTISAFVAGRGTKEIDELSRDAILQFGAALLQYWADPTPVHYVTTLAELNLRRGPGESFDVIERIEPGQQVLVTGIDAGNAWWRVACPDNTAGSCWISADSTLTEAVVPTGEDSN